MAQQASRNSQPKQSSPRKKRASSVNCVSLNIRVTKEFQSRVKRDAKKDKRYVNEQIMACYASGTSIGPEVDANLLQLLGRLGEWINRNSVAQQELKKFVEILTAIQACRRV